MIRLPKRASEELSAVAAARDELQVELGRNPTIVEQATRTGMSVDKISSLLEFRHDATSFDAIENFHNFHENREDETSIEADLLSAERKRVITEILIPQLDERERMAIELKYGLNGHEVTMV